MTGPATATAWQLADTGPAEIQLPSAHVSMLARLQDALRGEQPITLLGGDEGLGKTTLLRRLMIVEGQRRPVIAVGAQMSPLQLLRALAERLSMRWHELTLARMSEVHDMLRLHGESLGGILIVADDAARLDDGMLEFLRFWCVTPAARQGLLKVVVSGTPRELADLRGRPATGPLNAVVGEELVLAPLNARDAAMLLRARLEQLGVPAEAGLTSTARSTLLRHAAGNPKALILGADAVIRDALANSRFPVSGKRARSVLRGQRRGRAGARPRGWRRAAVLLVLLAAAALVFWDYRLGPGYSAPTVDGVRDTLATATADDGWLTRGGQWVGDTYDELRNALMSDPSPATDVPAPVPRRERVDPPAATTAQPGPADVWSMRPDGARSDTVATDAEAVQPADPGRALPADPEPAAQAAPSASAPAVPQERAAPDPSLPQPQCSDNALLRGGVPGYRTCFNAQGQRLEIKLWVSKPGDTMNGLLYGHDGMQGEQGRRQFQLLNPDVAARGAIPPGSVIRIPLQ